MKTPQIFIIWGRIKWMLQDRPGRWENSFPVIYAIVCPTLLSPPVPLSSTYPLHSVCFLYDTFSKVNYQLTLAMVFISSYYTVKLLFTIWLKTQTSWAMSHTPGVCYFFKNHDQIFERKFKVRGVFFVSWSQFKVHWLHYLGWGGRILWEWEGENWSLHGDQEAQRQGSGHKMYLSSFKDAPPPSCYHLMNTSRGESAH